MSPAQVERYIGSCLISGYKPRYRRYPDYGGYQQTWGLPLVAVARGKKEDRSPLSRLAIHTQGVPLIQSGRSQRTSRKEQKAQPPETKADVEPENALPRIIKPRKRRKKERKPPQESAIVTLKPYVPLCTDLAEPAEPSDPGGEEVAECQCRYCDPLGVIWEANGVKESSPWPGGEQHSTDADSGSGLEVSSQIVTSPNGHRDIEIRFFTTPTPQPQQQPPRPVSVSPPWR